MIINSAKCVGCGICMSYCPAGAIIPSGKKFSVDFEKCVECYVCYRAAICFADAITPQQLKWPRTLRNLFSSVAAIHKETGVPGRGTEEMKTNDVTGRFDFEEVFFSIDIGRPGIGILFEDAEIFLKHLVKLDVEFEKMNPLTVFMVDKKTGRLREDIKKERVHSAVIEIKTNINKIPDVIKVINNIAKTTDTVFSVGCGCRVNPDGTIPVKEYLDRNNIYYLPNGKTCIGLGEPSK